VDSKLLLNSNVASLSGPVVSIQCCCFLLLTLGKIYDDVDDDDEHVKLIKLF